MVFGTVPRCLGAGAMIILAVYVEDAHTENRTASVVPRIGDAVVVRGNKGLRVVDVKWLLSYDTEYVELRLANVAWERAQ